MSSSSPTLLSVYEGIAPFYDLVDLPFEYGRYRALRPLLFTGLSGRLLDAGVGTGRNIAYYPAGAEVVGVDLSPAMLSRAARRSRKSIATVQLIRMDCTSLDFPDDSFDAAVASFLFCTMAVTARASALRELSRVVKPSGKVRLLEYASAQNRSRRALTRVGQPWARWAFGAKLDQDIEPELAGASLIVARSRYVTANIKLVEATPALPTAPAPAQRQLRQAPTRSASSAGTAAWRWCRCCRRA